MTVHTFFSLEVKVLNQICSRPTMSLEAKATKFYEARFKFQVELEKAQKVIEESAQKKDRRVKDERLANTYEEQLTAAVSKNDEFFISQEN